MDNLCPHTVVHCKALDMCRSVGKPQLLTRDDGAAGVSVAAMFCNLGRWMKVEIIS